MATTTLKNLLSKITALWNNQLALCEKRKAKEFGDTAVEIMRYVGQRVNPRRMGMLVDGLPMTLDMQNEYLSTLNWAQLFVDVMAPYVYAAVPNRLVTAIRPQLPPELSTTRPDIVQQQQLADQRDRMTCFELQEVLNWSPRAYDAKKEGRMAVNEGLAKGRGVSWLELDDAPIRGKDGMPYKMPVLRSDSVDNLGIDGDCIHYRDAGYIYRRRSQPAYEIARLWGEDAAKLRSAAKQGMQSQQEEALAAVTQVGPIEPNSADGITSDVLTYYEFWSRIGLGEKLVGAPEELRDQSGFAEAMERLGRYVHFAILPGMDRPLGLDPEKLTALAAITAEPTEGAGGPGGPGEPGKSAGKKSKAESGGSEEVSLASIMVGQEATEAKPADGDLANTSLLDVLSAALEWPIKTYGRIYNPWPAAFLDFKPRVDSAWPKAILEAALPLQRFLDRIYEHIISRTRKAGRDVFIYNPAIGEKLIAAIQSMNDLEMVSVEEPGKIKEAIESMVYCLSFPEMNKDIFAVIKLAWDAFRESTGITPELLGGVPRSQDRSAEASKIKGSGLSRRPDDYAEAVESWESEKCALEAIGWRMLADQNFIASIFGETLDEVPGQDGQVEINWLAAPLTKEWIELVHTDDEFAAAAQINYDIEAGTSKRRNLALLRENATQLYQMYGQQAFATLMETGQSKPLEVLMRMVSESMQINTEPLVQAFAQAAQQRLAMQAQMGQPQGQPGQPQGQPGQAQLPSPQEPQQEEPQEQPQGPSASEQSAADQLASRWTRAAGGPQGPRINTEL